MGGWEGKMACDVKAEVHGGNDPGAYQGRP